MNDTSKQSCGLAWEIIMMRRTLSSYMPPLPTLWGRCQDPLLGCTLGHDREPKENPPLIYEVRKRKYLKVKEPLHADAWVSKIKISINLSMTHLRQFIVVWILICGFHLDEHARDDIRSKHTDNVHYSTTSAYLTQFMGTFYSLDGADGLEGLYSSKGRVLYLVDH